MRIEKQLKRETKIHSHVRRRPTLPLLSTGARLGVGDLAGLRSAHGSYVWNRTELFVDLNWDVAVGFNPKRPQ